VVDAEDGSEEVTIELENSPLAAMNDMDTTIENTAVSQPVDDTIIEPHDMEEHQSNKRRRVDNIDNQESKHCIVCEQLSWNGYQYVYMCDVRKYCHYHEIWEGPLHGIYVCQYAPYSVMLTLRHTEQKMTCLQLAALGVGQVGGLKRCIHNPETPKYKAVE
jgi:hypothetical protein